MITMSSDERRRYVAKRETELRASNPAVLAALAIDALDENQRVALFQALEMFVLPSRITKATIKAAEADKIELRLETGYHDAELVVRCRTPVALIDGEMARRTAVRRLVYMALRIKRFASSN